jgi:zinc/manganese transport system substrate-binding protein
VSPTFPPATSRRRHLRWAAGATALAALALAGCTTTPSKTAAGGSGSTKVINVVAAENFWGSLAEQLGGSHAKVTNIISKPDADPHDYEPTAADGRTVAAAKLVIVNGVGYDPWATQLVAANPTADRTVLTVGELVGAAEGANPHRWYNPDDVRKVIDQITTDFKNIDPANASYFDSRHSTVIGTDLKAYFEAIAEIKADYQGTPVGASESIFAMLAPALGLRLLTPESFLDSVSEGGDPTVADKTTVDGQIKNRLIKVFVYNSQNATPDIQTLVTEAKGQGIPVTTITETPRAGSSFQVWEVAQLTSMKDALAQGTGK